MRGKEPGWGSAAREGKGRIGRKGWERKRDENNKKPKLTQGRIPQRYSLKAIMQGEGKTLVYTSL